MDQITEGHGLQPDQRKTESTALQTIPSFEERLSWIWKRGQQITIKISLTPVELGTILKCLSAVETEPVKGVAVGQIDALVPRLERLLNEALKKKWD